MNLSNRKNTSSTATSMRVHDYVVLGVILLVLMVSAVYLWTEDRETRTQSVGAACPQSRTPTPIAERTDAQAVPQVQTQDAVQVRNLERERDRFTVRTFLSLSAPLAEDVDFLNVRVGNSNGRTGEHSNRSS
jgi:hypothetical protein